MSESLSSFTKMTANDPLLLFIAAVALVIVLTTLYRGYWVFVTHLLVFAFTRVLYLGLACGLTIMVVSLSKAIFGPVEERASSLLWAIIIAAAIIIGLSVLLGDNMVTRFLKKLTIDGELPQ